MRIGSLFSGGGGLDLGVMAALGGEVVWHCENEPGAARVLAHHWPGVPNLGDITAVDWGDWPLVDVLVGGFPCQDLSNAGKRRGLVPGTRSGLWEKYVEAIDRLRPGLVVIENVSAIRNARTDESREVCGVGPRGGAWVGYTHRALGRVVGDLARLGYDARWGSVRASDAGAPHRRERVFIAAHPHVAGREGLTWGDSGSGLTLLSTPRSTDGPKGGPGQRNGKGVADSLPAIGALLPTPVVTDSFGARNETSGRKEGSQHHGGRTMGDVVWKGSWGEYAQAIARWEQVFGCPAPEPTAPSKGGGRRLSPAFTEWLMGWPAGWVTDPELGLSHSQQLRILGNGVVPQQCALALRLLGVA